MKKTFDAVEMKRRGAERIYEITKDMTAEEELAFWHEQSEALRRLQQAVLASRKSGQVSNSAELAAFVNDPESILEPSSR